MKTDMFLNYSPCEVIGCRKVDGKLFGIELELEGRNVGLQDIATKGWERHQDGSLRGESIEYTTAGAKTLDESKKLVSDLFTKFQKNKVIFNNSIRTSTHVHLNFSDKPIKQCINFFSLFTLFEEILGYYSGEDRKGNLFCVSTREAEGIVGVLASDLAKGQLSKFAGDRYKYAACNLSTIYKFGTVEVRTMRGATSAEQVNKWLDILGDMYEYSIEKMKSPAGLIRDLSFLGADGLMKQIFSPQNYAELLTTFPKIRSIHDSLMEGARILQVFAYEFDDDFTAIIKIEEKKMGSLRVKIPIGPHRGESYAIYRPDGNRWNVVPRNPLGAPKLEFWQDGQQVYDCPQITWNEERGRFVATYADGEIVECRWARHEIFGNEGPPAERRPLPRNVVEAMENNDEEIDDWFEEEPEEEDF